jgi:tRNA G10  N-methylase Trm11
MLHFLSFGTHPRLSLAEFRAIKPDLPAPITVGACAVVDDPAWDGARLMEILGGTVKLGDVIETLSVEDVDAETIADLMAVGSRESGVGSKVMGHESRVTSHDESDALRTTHNATNLDFGLTVVGGSPGVRKALEKLPIAIKKVLKARGIRSRWVTGEGGSPLSPAAVSKLRMDETGSDITLIVEGGRVYVGRTVRVQNADAWSERDYGRPARDGRAGMLPPKLARMMVNLARIPDGSTVFDPFCGNGTILMEAAIATNAARIIGSDIDAKQVATTERNDQWLTTRGIVSRKAAAGFDVFAGDARRISTKVDPRSIDVIVTEGTLGPPLRGREPMTAIEKTKREIEDIWRESLKDWTKILKPGGRVVGIWPSFKTEGGLARVGLDEEVALLGYRLLNPLEGWDDTNAPLVYHRPGQHVARRIVVMERV